MGVHSGSSVSVCPLAILLLLEHLPPPPFAPSPARVPERGPPRDADGGGRDQEEESTETTTMSSVFATAARVRGEARLKRVTLPVALGVLATGFAIGFTTTAARGRSAREAAQRRQWHAGIEGTPPSSEPEAAAAAAAMPRP